MKSETLRTLSEATGYSPATISRIINGKASQYRISKLAEETVMKEVRRSGYMPFSVAQKLRNVRSGLVALLLPSVSNPFFADMASVVISEMYSNRYTTIVVDTMEDEAHLVESVKTMVSRQVEGIIAVPCGTDGTVMEKVGESLPVVLIDRFYEGTPLSYVTTNNYQGSLLATRHLLAAGHRKIACIQGATTSMPNRERVKGYVDAMRSGGAGDEIRTVGNDFSIRNGYLETKLLLGCGDPPTAIFALSNTILLGAMKAIRESALRIPGDISLITFDDNLYMDYMTPVITRISQPVEDMARLASKLLLDSLGVQRRSATQLRLAPSLIMGGSVKTIV
ncbi:MAG: LacI family DNA-binding transcriptional regulator [Bacteroidales bacterium]|nr:LacI family DNA-binding transcriptional regulator [Bacteroidales bacterium]